MRLAARSPLETIHRELGASIEDLFVRFDPEPIAAAVGQYSLSVVSRS